MMAARIWLAIAIGSAVVLAGALLLPDLEQPRPRCLAGSITTLTTDCAIARGTRHAQSERPARHDP
ncbi:hypothetical protein [Bradyrhizobium sp. SZCCHNS3002]|uniref:hypothetical protein n=1 Tax=Bradyrhizobium sp. SZCCHNS3002 TaxID=3057310 RepID=UPI0028E5F1E3|nr:hypothetical protein [Bradyrhizobium sp. SZCCHNS3002]